MGLLVSVLMSPKGKPLPQTDIQPQNGDIPRRKEVKQHKLPPRMVSTIQFQQFQLADNDGDLAEMMASVTYQSQQTEGEKSAESQSPSLLSLRK